MSGDKNQHSLNDYELIPIKPLYELKKEVQRLRDELKKEDSSSKILVKHMNLDIMIQKKIEKMIMRQEELKERLNKIVGFFEKVVEEEESERETERDIILNKLSELEVQNQLLHKKIDQLTMQKEDITTVLDRIKRDEERINKGLRSNFLKYRRTKNV